ncbi:MAG TPA: helicase-associated domain-containing protein [Ktedonobacterales bacterium]
MTTNDALAGRDVEAAVAFQRDLYLYWWAARDLGELALTSRGFLARSTLRRLRAQWPTSDDDRSEASNLRLYYLRRLLERLGLLRPPSEASGTSASASNARLVAAESAIMARYLAHPLAERLRICVRLWVAGGWWPDGKPASIPASLHTPVQPRIALARRRLIEMLAATEPGSPAEIPGVALAALAPHAPRIIGGTAARHKPRDIAEERNQSMQAALAGPLQWMGLVAKAAHRDEDVPGERRLVVTPAVLALRREPVDTLVQETPGRVVIQPNLDIVAYHPLTAPTLFTLDSCASRGTLERVAHYRLTKHDVTRAQQHGWSDEEIARSLEALSGNPLPGNVRVRLADWTRAASRIQFTPQATLLTTATPAILDALQADRNARGWVIRRLGPTLALIQTSEIDLVRRWLLAHGELPAVEQAGQ